MSSKTQWMKGGKGTDFIFRFKYFLSLREMPTISNQCWIVKIFVGILNQNRNVFKDKRTKITMQISINVRIRVCYEPVLRTMNAIMMAICGVVVQRNPTLAHCRWVRESLVDRNLFDGSMIRPVKVVKLMNIWVTDAFNLISITSNNHTEYVQMIK